MRTIKGQKRDTNQLSDRGGFKLKDACAYLGGLAPITVRRLIARGLLRRVPEIRHLLFAKGELDRFLAGSNSRNTQSPR